MLESTMNCNCVIGAGYIYTLSVLLKAQHIFVLYVQVLSPDMSLATVRAYVWKKSEDLVLNYRVVQGR